ncbi:MAG: pullulanase [Balneolaceae bacterium]|nr:MAG: pullulanase [Balneolaceae bacterium]
MSDLNKSTPGVTVTDTSTTFRLHCPDVHSVTCVIFDSYDSDRGIEHAMRPDPNGDWLLKIHGNLNGKWYGYKVSFRENNKNLSPYSRELFADPYSKHVTVRNNYRQEARSYIFSDSFDWQGATHQFPDDPRDLVIYETHLKDLTAHPKVKSSKAGFYNKFVDTGHPGGINYLKKLGVNCVEFLPLQKFAPIEPPYGAKTEEGFHNSWNVYSANYWGYMTSFFFAPESFFASDLSNNHSGKTPVAVSEFKEMVKKLHEEKITVIMDVVYNHTSLFDINPLTHLLHDTYLRKNEKGHYLNRSGTGNEFRSEHPVARQLIIDSLLYWMDEYQIDGFRFDLAALFDKKTWDEIKFALHKKYPKAVLIAEPWGGYYSPHEFSNHDWSSWNDRIRNSLKGSDPLHDRGFIFSDWQHETRRLRLENIFRGTLVNHEGGLYQTSKHAVNYLESHDGYTLGDFIRIGLNPEIQDQKITDIDKHVKLNDDQLRISKLAALSLFSAQGITMIHAGQEFARSKIIAKSIYGDPDEGKMDHNSYQKDNATNWIDFDQIDLNRSLYEYYRALIQIRIESPALRKSDPEGICFDHHGDPLVVSFYISGNTSGDLYDYYIILNGNFNSAADLTLPSGSWEVIANGEMASLQIIDLISGNIRINPTCGFLLRKLRH